MWAESAKKTPLLTISSVLGQLSTDLVWLLTSLICSELVIYLIKTVLEAACVFSVK